MIKINDDGEIIINGQKIDTGVDNVTHSSSTTRRVVIKNGKVIQNDFENSDEQFDMEDFHNDFIDQMGPAFQHLKKSTKIKCEYCGSVYKSSKIECPNCGATKNTI